MMGREEAIAWPMGVQGQPTVVSLTMFWLSLVFGCGALGLLGFAGFYIYVLGHEVLFLVFEGLMPIFTIILVLVTFLEVIYQQIFKSSMMKNMSIALGVCSLAALAAAVIQFNMPEATRYDTLSSLLGFAERHVAAIACEYAASVLAIAGGVFAFIILRRLFRRYNWAH